MSDTTSGNRQVAVLRAINVGGHNVKMERLRALFTELGCTRVETLIASGNVLFDPPVTRAKRSASRDGALEAAVEAHLHAALGYAVATFIRSPEEIARAAAHEWDAGEDSLAPLNGIIPTTVVGFLKSVPGAEAVARVTALGSETDQFRFDGRELYWLCRTHLGESKIAGGLLEKALGMPMTMRNITTVRKLAAKSTSQTK